jgi:hypothetical protein
LVSADSFGLPAMSFLCPSGLSHRKQPARLDATAAAMDPTNEDQSMKLMTMTQVTVDGVMHGSVRRWCR